MLSSEKRPIMSSTQSASGRLPYPPHTVHIRWKNRGPDFVRGQYSREHTWTFDGGVTVAASPSPFVVPTPWSNPDHVDPEEALLAAISSCHMLTVLWLASKAGWIVEAYEDASEATLAKNERRVPWVSEAILRPRITWGGDQQPSDAEVAALHAQAHDLCFIANSVRTEIRIEAPDAADPATDHA